MNQKDSNDEDTLCDAGHRKLDIVDSILKKLEKHAENLESTVSRRTAELEEEKRKTDLLLYRMLPRLV